MIYFIIVILIILFYFRVTDNFSSNILPCPLLVLNNKLIYETDKLYSKINPIVYNKNKLNNLITKKCKNNTNINNYNIGTVKKSYTNMKNYDKICNYKDAIFRDKLWKCHGNHLPKKMCEAIESDSPISTAFHIPARMFYGVQLHHKLYFFYHGVSKQTRLQLRAQKLLEHAHRLR